MLPFKTTPGPYLLVPIDLAPHNRLEWKQIAKSYTSRGIYLRIESLFSTS